MRRGFKKSGKGVVLIVIPGFDEPLGFQKKDVVLVPQMVWWVVGGKRTFAAVAVGLGMRSIADLRTRSELFSTSRPAIHFDQR